MLFSQAFGKTDKLTGIDVEVRLSHQSIEFAATTAARWRQYKTGLEAAKLVIDQEIATVEQHIEAAVKAES